MHPPAPSSSPGSSLPVTGGGFLWHIVAVVHSFLQLTQLLKDSCWRTHNQHRRVSINFLNRSAFFSVPDFSNEIARCWVRRRLFSIVGVWIKQDRGQIFFLSVLNEGIWHSLVSEAEERWREGVKIVHNSEPVPLTTEWRGRQVQAADSQWSEQQQQKGETRSDSEDVKTPPGLVFEVCPTHACGL